MPPDRWQRTWLLVAALCLFGFAVIAAVVNRQGSVGFDPAAISAVQGPGIPIDLWLAATQAGGGAILLPVGVGLVLGLLWQGRIRLAIIVGLALVAAAVWTEAVKLWVERPRPPDPLAPYSGYSFPSGHTFNSTVTYGLVALVAWRSHLRSWARRLAVASLVVLVVMVGLSRIALGVHYPSDVLAGWLGGMTIVAVVAAVPLVVFFASRRRAAILSTIAPTQAPSLDPAPATADAPVPASRVADGDLDA